MIPMMLKFPGDVIVDMSDVQAVLPNPDDANMSVLLLANASLDVGAPPSAIWEALKQDLDFAEIREVAPVSKMATVTELKPPTKNN